MIHAHAAAIAGDSQLHKQSYDAALPAIDAIPDEEDRRIVLQTFEQVPRHESGKVVKSAVAKGRNRAQ